MKILIMRWNDLQGHIMGKLTFKVTWLDLSFLPIQGYCMKNYISIHLTLKDICYWKPKFHYLIMQICIMCFYLWSNYVLFIPIHPVLFHGQNMIKWSDRNKKHKTLAIQIGWKVVSRHLKKNIPQKSTFLQFIKCFWI